MQTKNLPVELPAELKNFQAWDQIKNSIEWDGPVSVLKDWEHLKSTLDSGLMEEMEYHPDYTRHLGDVPQEFIDQYTWLLPTPIGVMCYKLWFLLNEQRLKTKQAYQQGKCDAISTLTSKMYELAEIDQAEFEKNNGN